MKTTVTIIAFLFVLLLLLFYLCAIRPAQAVREVQAVCEQTTTTAPNAAGQFVEAMDEGGLKAWIAAHKSDRKIVALTGLGTGGYGRDDVFIVVSEPFFAERK